MSENLIIVFDTETTGFSPEKNEIVQLSYILYDINEKRVVYATKPGDDIVNIKGYIPKKTSDIHGITKDMTRGKPQIKQHIDEFISYCDQATRFVGHNIKFDIKMITGQMKKVMAEFPETVERYSAFLERFEMVGKDLPDAAYCTMMESKGICAQILGLKRAKFQKLMEVHKLLFNQNVGGQLHNALVDISVTLRVYLKLTMGIDICESQTEFNPNVTEVTDNTTICSLINPVSIEAESIENVEYTGELITGLNIIPGGLEEEKIMVQTFAKEFVSQVQKQAISNVISKIAPDQTMCTTITICKAILKTGKRSGEICGRPPKGNSEFCGIHSRTKKVTKKLQEIPQEPQVQQVMPIISTAKVAPTEINEDTTVQSIVREKPTTTVARSFVSGLFTKKNKVGIAPEGGKRKTNRRRQNKRRKTNRRRPRRLTK